MEVEFLILADGAQAVAGKLYLLGGGWDQYRAHSFPVQAPLGIALGLTVPWQETNQKHSVELSIINEDGDSVAPPMNAQVEVGRPPGIKPGSPQRVIIAVNAILPIPKAGRYEVVAKVEGQVLRRVHFDALQVTPPAAPQS